MKSTNFVEVYKYKFQLFKSQNGWLIHRDISYWSTKTEKYVEILKKWSKE